MWYMSYEIDRRAVVPAPPAAVWADIVDGSSWPSWSPLGRYQLEQPGTTDPASAPLGEIRTFRTKQVVGESVAREEVVEVVPEKRLSYALLGGNLPLEGYRADIDLTPVAGGTEVRWHSTFTASRVRGWFYQRALGAFIQRTVDGLAAKHRS